MRYFKHLLAIVALILSFTACEKDNDIVPESGIVVSLHELGLDVTSRATPSELGKPLAAQFVLDILDESKQTVVYHGPFSDNVIPVAPSTYTITASYGQNVQIAKDSPYYEGTVKGVTVASKEEKHVTIACNVANSLLSVKYANQKVFDDLYSYYQVIVQNGNMSIGLDNPGNSAYFVAGSKISVYFEGILKGSDQKVRHELQHDVLLTPLTAGQHLILTLKAANVAADIAKVEVVTEIIAATIPMEWLPKPKIESVGFINNELSFIETESVDASLNLKTAMPIQDLKLKFHFEDSQFSSLNDKEFLLSNAEDKKAVENVLKITLPSVGQENVVINLTDLIGRMQTNSGVPTVNSITVDTRANNRWSSEDASSNRTYLLKCGKPEFNVSVSNESVWTKEFTINPFQVTKGNLEKLSAGMQYEVSDNKEKWTNVPETELVQKNLNPGKKYYVRCLYRKAVSSDIVEVTTYPIIELLNGNMEEWRELLSPQLRVGTGGWNQFNPKRIQLKAHYPNENSGHPIWACVNQKTFEATPNINSTYNQNPSTFRTNGVSGYAAALRTVGWDNGSGNTVNIIYHISAGKLFIGNYTYVHKSNTETYNYGMAYNSKPTGLRFWHKYEPYNNDQYKAYIVLENRDNGAVTRVGYGEVINGSNITAFTEVNVPITYTNTELNITHMYVVFSSSAKCSDNDKTETTNLKGMVTNGDYHNGSILTIDDVSLVYDK